MSDAKGILYVVATPIGNRGDISPRAREILASVSLIAAEDTRHSRPLLAALHITAPLVALHEHNERQLLVKLTTRLLAGESLALISDAGTPLISDPGFPLVRECHRLGIRVSPVPGPCAAVCALSAAGLPTDRFLFAGFTARTAPARQAQFAALKGEEVTLVFYESGHRVRESLDDMATVFGPQRAAVMARELTKLHETIVSDTLDGLRRLLAADADQLRGEFVILVAGARRQEGDLGPETRRVLQILAQELPLRQAAALAARITGEKKNRLYREALSWQT